MPDSLPGSLWAPEGEFTLPPTGSGALDAMTVVVKDLYDIAGHVTAAGNPTLAQGAPATRSAEVVTRALDAGGTILGKTATDELAMGMFGVNSHFGTPANAAAPDRVPGGSTSGSATAVAAGIADLGVGTDTGGSIRVPGAFQGLYGLRSTHGRIPLTGVVPMAPAFDTCGLLAREPATLAAGLAALADPARPDAASSSRPVGWSPSRLVLFSDLVARCAPAMAAVARRTARSWASRLGVPLVEEPLVAGPLPADLVEIFWPLMSRQLWESHGAWVATVRPTLGEGIEDRIRAAGTVTDAQVDQAEELRVALTQRLAGVLDDALGVLPTAIDAAPLRSLAHAELMAWRDRNLALVVPGSLAGVPQLTLPSGTVHQTGTGTAAPVGVSLLGLPGDDETLLELAGWLGDQAATGTEKAAS